MKKISQYICILAAMLLSAPAVTNAADDGEDVKGGLVFSKQVESNTPDKVDGHYTINIDAYATGTMVTTTVTQSKPADIVLALDYSSSMVRERLDKYYKLPYERKLTYNDYQLVAPTSPTNSKAKETAKYYYYYEGKYYEILQAKGGEKNLYYYLQYTDNDGVTHYLQPAGGDGATKPTSATKTDDTVYKGPLYEKSNAPKYYYAYYVDGNSTYYYNNGWTTTNFPAEYSKGENDIICNDADLYTEANGEYSKSQKTDGYTYTDLTNTDYYVRRSYTSPCYYAYYEDGVTTNYLQPGGGTSNEITDANKSVESNTGTLYNGQLYQLVAPEPGEDIYYAYYVNSEGNKQYWINNAWKADFNGLPIDAQHNPDNVIYHGQLYEDNKGENRYGTAKDYSYTDLSGLLEGDNDYYVKGDTKTYYYWYIEVGNKKYYLKPDGTGVTENMPITVTKNDGVVWKGQLYKLKQNKKDYEAVPNNGSRDFKYNETTTFYYEYNSKKYQIKKSSTNVDNYYPIHIQAPTYVASYTPAAGTTWNYTKLSGNTKYYYKVGDDNYKEVKTATADVTKYKYYLVQAYQPSDVDYTKVAGSDNKVWAYRDLNNKTYYYNVGDNYYEVSQQSMGLDLTGKSNTQYCLYILVDDDNGGKKVLYLNGTTAQEQEHLVNGTTTVIYSGDLYSNTRLVSLQIAAGDFLDEIAAKTAGANGILGDEDDVKNKVELVLFCKSLLYSPDLQPVTSENIAEWKAEMYKHPGYEGTAHDLAMKEAEETLTEAYNRDTENERMQTVVFFTDGETFNTGNGGNTERVSDANKALVSSNNLKEIGVPIFVVSMLSQTTLDDYNWITWFLETLSSKYGYLEGVNEGDKMMVTSGTSPYPVNETTSKRGSMFTGNTNYYLSTDDTGDLSSIFRAITTEIHTGEGSDIELGANSVVVVDAMTKHFKLPDGATENDITVKAYPCSGKDSNGEFTFDESKAVTLGNGVLKDTKVYVKGKEVDVVGFDYAANYVGEHGEEGKYEGWKLVISFPIYIDPANPGGANLQTNEAYSGIYTTNVDKDGNPVIKDGLVERKDPVSYFEQPQVDLPNIVIRKAGMMKPGESATFLIEAVDASGNVIMKDGKPVDSFSIVISCKDAADAAAGYLSAKVKLQSNARYKVTETSWAWGYTPKVEEGHWTKDDGHSEVPTTAGAYYIIRNVNDYTEEPDGLQSATGVSKGTIFYFENTKTTQLDEMKYSEAFKRNVFYTPKESIWKNSTGSGEEEVVGGDDTDDFDN